MVINKYGWPLVRDCIPEEAHDYYNNNFYLIDDQGSGVVYKCWHAHAKRVIWRETTTAGVTTLEFGYGAWDDRANLTYAPINGGLNVEV